MTDIEPDELRQCAGAIYLACHRAANEIERLRSQWLDISTAPRDGTPILLFHKLHGQVQGWYAQPAQTGEGMCWVFGDDLYQVEVDQHGKDGPYDDGPISHWMNLPKPPAMEGEI